MNKVELTPAELAIIRQKAEAAENCSPSPWVFREMPAVKGEVRDSENFQVAGWFTLRWQAEHIAAADPATVLAMVEEIEQLRAELAKRPVVFCRTQNGKYVRDQVGEIAVCTAKSAKLFLEDTRIPRSQVANGNFEIYTGKQLTESEAGQ